MKTFFTNTNIIAGTSFALISACVFPTETFAQKEKSDKVVVKTITIVNGDTTITEKTMNEKDLNKTGGTQSQMVFISDNGKVQRMNIDSLIKAAGMENFDILINSDGNENDTKKTMKKIIVNAESDKPGAYSYSYTINDDDTVGMKDGNETIDERIYNIVSSDGKTNKVIAINTKIIIKDVTPETKDKTTAVTNELKINKLNFFPNPSSGNFTLEFESPNNDAISIKITDVNGKQVYNETVKGEGHQSKQIDISNESKGVYFILLQQGKNISTKKITIE